MHDFLLETSSRYPNLTSLYSIGKTAQNRDLWVMVVSSSPHKHMIGKPNVKYVANIHGNEVVGRELMLHLIHLLVTQYGTDDHITWLLDNTRIHILPSMNPDGFAKAKEGYCEGTTGRGNSRGFDLNRNFPDHFEKVYSEVQLETEAIKQWISKIQFVLSGCFHGGALVASYPYDNIPNRRSSSSKRQRASLSPDNDVFKHLSMVYSTNHKTMHLGIGCSYGSRSFSFKNGITNAAEWYPLPGGMQDFNYIQHGCMEVTFEISCCKYPPANQLKKFWEENRIALVSYLAEAHKGVQGFVIDEFGKPIDRASVIVKGRDIKFSTTKYGEFWRILLPGNYTLQVSAEGYSPSEIDFTVFEQHPTRLNVTLHRTKAEQEKKGLCGYNLSAKSFMRRANSSEFPWIVGVYRKSGTYVCAGALLSNGTVLTVAHRLQGLQAHHLIIRIDQSNQRVQEIIINENFNTSKSEHNFALLRFTELAEFAVEKLISLPKQNINTSNCIMVDWEARGRENKINRIEVEIIKHDNCSELPFNKNKKLCQTEPGNPIVCEIADVSGSLTKNYRLVGLTATFCNGSLPQQPVYITNVVDEASWINKKL
ncbi:hypothetical protein HCN44_007134 [Aphidius gifuensis]|uniref:Carboxypeptidase n=1 Tax=Aphidius gifuensis TaxID=684658 RepID=A0A834XP24_APHGI|nr:carboxypeptidase D-like [Aphidius gifuensis]KAF7988824.1 hypothetical protein HCN44_007134 [Aphidius gifuensis]